MEQTLERLRSQDKAVTLKEYGERLEKLIRTDHRMRLIPYWYPYDVYRKKAKDTSETIIREAYETHRYESIDAAIYIHIPFCRQKCGYCQWYTIIKPEDEMEVYTQLILKEIDLYGNINQLKDKEIKSVYFGGGTPNLLSINQISRIVDRLKYYYDLTKVVEFSIEIFPDYINEEYISSLKKLGFNRISMGIQTFNRQALKNVYKRTVSKNDNKYLEIVKSIKENGMMLCIDMLSDLPGQTYDKLRYDLSLAIGLQPDQIAYAYTELRNSTLKNDINKVPSYINCKACYFHVSNHLSSCGYQQIDDMMFTKVGTPLLWVDLRSIASVELVFGPKSRGYSLDGSAYMNLEYDDWKTCLMDNRFPIASFTKLSDEELIRKYIITGIYYGRIDCDEFHRRFGASIEKVFPNKINALLELGLIFKRNYDNGCQYYNYMGINKHKPNLYELSEMGKHYVEALRILFTTPEYRRMIYLDHSIDKRTSEYIKYYKEIL